MALTLPSLLSLNPALNPHPRSLSIRRPFLSVSTHPRPLQLIAKSSVDSDFSRVIEFEQADPVLDTTGGDFGGVKGGGKGDGSGGGDGEGSEEEEEGKKKKKGGEMLMSQKFTLLYAVLVGVGGIMGYVKSGSQKSAAAGGISALLLMAVYKLLPIYPTVASCLGLGISGGLLSVMFSRFRQSGKVFPAGVVSLVSLIMTVGYAHGLLRH